MCLAKVQLLKMVCSTSSWRTRLFSVGTIHTKTPPKTNKHCGGEWGEHWKHFFLMFLVIILTLFWGCSMCEMRLNIYVAVSIPSTRKTCEIQFLIKRNQRSWGNGWFLISGKKGTRWAWNILSFQIQIEKKRPVTYLDVLVKGASLNRLVLPKMGSLSVKH